MGDKKGKKRARRVGGGEGYIGAKGRYSQTGTCMFASERVGRWLGLGQRLEAETRGRPGKRAGRQGERERSTRMALESESGRASYM